jgi:hypothetical protein
MLQSRFTPAVLIIYLCMYVYIYICTYSCLTPLYSGFTYNIYIIEVCIRVWRVVEQKLVISKHFKALRRHLALVVEWLPRLKHFIVRLY